MDSSFFQPVGPGWPRLVGPVGGEMGGFPNPPLDPATQFRINMKGTPRERDVRHKVTWSRAIKKKSMEQKAEIARARPMDQYVATTKPLRVEKEPGKPESPRSPDLAAAFDALEFSSRKYLLGDGVDDRSPGKMARAQGQYSSPKYLLGDGAENKSPLNLARAQGRIEHMETGNEVNEALGSLENTFMAESEPSPGESVAQVKPNPVK